MELPDPVRQRLGNFSRTVFSDSSRTGPEYSEGPGEWPRPERCGRASFGASRFCPDLKWRFRLQRVLRGVGSPLEEELGAGAEAGALAGPRLEPGLVWSCATWPVHCKRGS